MSEKEQKRIIFGFGLKIGIYVSATVILLTSLLSIFFYYRARLALYYQLRVKLESLSSMIAVSIDRTALREVIQEVQKYPQRVKETEVTVFLTDSSGNEVLDASGNRAKRTEIQKTYSYDIPENEIERILSLPSYRKLSVQLTNFRDNLYNLDLLNEKLDIESRTDENTRTEIQNLVQKQPTRYKLFRYAFLCIPTNHTFTPVEIDGEEKRFISFLADSIYETVDDVSYPGDPYEITEQEFYLKTFQYGLPSASEEPFTDEWGTQLESLAPILDEKGNVIAAVGIDVTVEAVETELKNIRNSSIILILVFAFISLIAAVILARIFSKPINKLNEGVSRFAAKEFSTRIHFKKQSRWSYDQIGRLADNFNKMAEIIEDYSKNLEEMVRKRTEELNQSLEEVRKLTIQQHGDYFLTSLLIEPLRPNKNSNECIRTDFYLRQKKQFEFRKKISELGGDICISDSFKLEGKEFTVFMNGDAMGKSMQGAGGAIVMGVVFNSIINRTRSGDLQLSPKDWLEKVYYELESVFSSFDGSMLISAVIGLMDQEGRLYYLNAAHPYTALYRNGIATFIEDEIHTQKIGINQQKAPWIYEFQLEPGDMLFCGSDGRDDLEIELDEFGTRIMNENEFLFLNHIQESGGNLEKLVDVIQNAGNLTDDISLLKVEYLGHVNKNGNYSPDKINNLYRQARAKLREKDYEKAYQHALELLLLQEDSPEIHKLVGKTAYLLKKYGKAAYHLERAFYLNNDHKNLLLGIARSYYELGDYQRAYYYANLHIEHDPQNKISLQIIENVQKTKGEDIKNFEETILGGRK